MNHFGVSWVYATALYNVAVENESMNECFKVMGTLTQQIGNSKELKNFLAIPFIPAQEKLDLLSKIIPESTPIFFKNFLQVLEAKKRLPYIEKIFSVLSLLIETHKNQIEVQIKTPHPLSKEAREFLSEKIRQITLKHPILNEQTDLSIGGGFIAYFDSYRLDASMKLFAHTLCQSIKESII